MRMIVLGLAGALMASGAGAQVLGGQLGGSVQGTLGGADRAGVAVDGTVSADQALPDTRPLDNAAARSVDRTDRVANRNGRSVHVDAGASVRVSRGTRCYYDDYYYDPAYRDGNYYCERSSSGVAAGARVGGH